MFSEVVVMSLQAKHLASRMSADTGGDERERVRRRIQDRRDFGAHLVCYLVVNGFLVVIWALTGGGYFWPAWVMGAWGVGLVLHAWDVFLRRPVSEADIDAELRRRGRQEG
jgi:2TM domain